MDEGTTYSDIRYIKPLAKWDEIKPFQIIGRRPPGQPRDNLEFESHRMSITDIRTVIEPFSLDIHGFQWLKHDHAFSPTSDPSIDEHIRSLEARLKELLDVEDVFTFQYQFRKAQHDREPS
ncbi:hypothetical protein BDV96DRAFT_641639 [Lophiotrema nucula]|uniref:Uncharacterized protein n=1 Tax=Lophiotrema nucula TaxID=690887 RepID=A0A6A5ZN08_9PLEO|nr:hypothetical protein BDV96DRAFT_641639 [Lophiotrema nucula]